MPISDSNAEVFKLIMTETWKDGDDFINGIAQHHSASNVSFPPPLSNASILIPNDE